MGYGNWRVKSASRVASGVDEWGLDSGVTESDDNGSPRVRAVSDVGSDIDLMGDNLWMGWQHVGRVIGQVVGVPGE